MSAARAPESATAHPFARLPRLVEPRAGLGGGAAWLVGASVALALHAGAGLRLLPDADPSAAPAAPEAAVMIDLPPDLAMPPLESVESVAAPEVSALAADATPSLVEADSGLPEAVPAEPETAAPEATALPPDAAEPSPAEPPEDVEPASSPDEASPETAEPAPVETTAAAQPVEPLEAPPSEVVEPVRAAEPVAAEETPAIAPAPPVLPTRRPAPAVERKPSPVVAAAREVRPKRRVEAPAAKTARPAAVPPKASASASAAAVDGRRASGAGRPDPNLLAGYLSSVRADIMRQRRGLDLDGRGRTAVVRFTIDASGALAGVALAASSGDARLDAAAMAMVRRASPVPALPGALGGSLKTRLPVRFD